MKYPIDRQAAIDALADYIHNVDKVMGTGHLSADDCKDAATSVLADLPSVQSERKIGKWVDDIYCSECGWVHETDPGFIGSVDGFNFCPQCGADMRGE